MPARLGVYHGRGDNLVVRTAELREVLLAFIEEHDAKHPREVAFNGGKTRQDDQWSFSGRNYLAFHSGRSQKTLHVILSLGSEYTTLSVADSFLSAIDQAHLLSDEVPGALWVGKDPRVGKNFGRWEGKISTRRVQQHQGG